MSKVSIITALYNHEPYIAQAIESVLAQTYTDWEHVIWDDGSTDGGLAIAQRYAERYPEKIKVFTHSGGINRGQENTRNAALKKASGRYLALLDSDDYYHPRKFEYLVPLLADHRVGLAYGSAEFQLEPSGRKFSSGIKIEPHGKVFEELVSENFICAGATLFRRECIEKGLKFDPTFKTIGEYPLWLKIARDWEIAHIPKIVATWRDHGANLGTKLALRAKGELVQLCERLSNDPEYAEHGPAIQRALAKKRYDYASELYFQLELSSASEQSKRVLYESEASAILRAKAFALMMLTKLGKHPNRYLSRVKRTAWELRHPFARAAKSSREKV
jgi:glycosyltransferase involved in cell wall biosynthesis